MARHSQNGSSLGQLSTTHQTAWPRGREPAHFYKHTGNCSGTTTLAVYVTFPRTIQTTMNSTLQQLDHPHTGM